MASSLLLGLKLKQSTRDVSFRQTLGEYIDSHYGTAAGERVSADIDELDLLRALVTGVVLSVQSSTESLIVQYYSNLRLIEKRFPSIDFSTFQWSDAFQPEHSSSSSSITVEIAATVFNLAAFLSQLAINSDKDAPDDLAAAGKHLMKAAGALAYLRSELEVGRLEASTLDSSPECLMMLESLLISQAIECILEKGAKAGAGKATLARLARQVSTQYVDIYNVLCGPQLKEHFERPWRYTFRVKAHYYQALSFLHQGDHLRAKLDDEDVQLAVRSQIRYAQEAKNVILEAQRLCANVKFNPMMKEEIDRMAKEVTARVAELQRDNASTYLQRVVPVSDLQQIEPLPTASLPQAVTLEYLSEPIPSLTFKSVVPEQVTRDWSKYTDMLDKMIRREQERIDQADDVSRLRLREMELPDRLNATQVGNEDNVPDAVLLEVQRIEKMGGLASLVHLADQLDEMNRSISEELDECRRAPDAARYAAKIDAYAGNLSVAKRTDSFSRSKLRDHEDDLRGLTVARAAAQAPHVESRMLLMDSTEPAEAAQALEIGIEGIRALSEQRKKLEQTLKRTKDGDDIVETLLSTTVDGAAVFADHLAKYDPIKRSIAENIHKQQEILDAMKNATHVFEDSYDFDDWERKRRAMVERWRVHVDVFNDINASLNEGIEFYVTLSDAVSSLKRALLGTGTGTGTDGLSGVHRSNNDSHGVFPVHDVAHDFSSRLHMGNGRSAMNDAHNANADVEVSGTNPLLARR